MALDATLDVLAATVADLERTWTALNAAQDGRRADYRRVEAQAVAPSARGDAAEARLIAAE